VDLPSCSRRLGRCCAARVPQGASACQWECVAGGMCACDLFCLYSLPVARREYEWLQGLGDRPAGPLPQQKQAYICLSNSCNHPKLAHSLVQTRVFSFLPFAPSFAPGQACWWQRCCITLGQGRCRRAAGAGRGRTAACMCTAISNTGEAAQALLEPMDSRREPVADGGRHKKTPWCQVGPSCRMPAVGSRDGISSVLLFVLLATRRRHWHRASHWRPVGVGQLASVACGRCAGPKWVCNCTLLPIDWREALNSLGIERQAVRLAQEVWKLSWKPCPPRPDSPQVSRKSRGMISDTPKS
jgi:hypothetical protein